MTPLQLYYFMGRCLVMEEDAGARQRVEAELLSGKVPWEELVWAGSNHFVLPALCSAFQRNHLLPLLPPELAEHLLHIYELNLKRNQKIVEQSAELARVLNNQGIEPLFIKGAGQLLENLYDDPGDRIMMDIDILVPEADILPATRVLRENGYAQPAGPGDDSPEDHHHLPGFEHEHYPAMVELHRSVLPAKYRDILSPGKIESGKKRLEGLNAWVLSREDQLVLHFIHSQLVGQEYLYRSISMKGLYDFYLLMKKHSPPVASLSKKYPHKFNAYCALASATFNHAPVLEGLKTHPGTGFLKKYEYLINHPGLGSLYQLLVLYSERIKKIIRLYSTAPFSRQSRLYIRKKTGSREARKQYFRKLKKEIVGSREL